MSATKVKKDLLFSRSYEFMVDLVRPVMTPYLEHRVRSAAAPVSWRSGLDGVYPSIPTTAGVLFEHINDAGTVIG